VERKREYLKRLKQAFDARDIEIPFPHLTVYPGSRKDGSAPPLHLVSQAR
jgi:small conductance mechanosensitive channel